jgi:demethylmenaquinone methyltransferase/2-methoxy-6-polyprenyl-1,4-benzoquinol methylase
MEHRVLEEKPGAPPVSRAPISGLPQYWSDERGRRRFTDRLFDDTAGDYDFAERLLGFGSGPWYRRQALARAGLVRGMRVLDIATGTGLVAREALALVGPEGSVVGLDPSAGMLAQAGKMAFPLVRGFGERLPCRDASFDFVSMGFALRHVADLEVLFREMHRVLRPGGVACVLELTQPEKAFAAVPLRFFMTRLLPIAARIAGRPDAGKLMTFYSDTIEACVPPATVLAALGRAGFAKPGRNVCIGLFSEYVAIR